SGGTTVAKIKTSGATQFAGFQVDNNVPGQNYFAIIGSGSRAGTLFGLPQASLGMFYSNNVPLVIGTQDAFDLSLGSANVTRMTISSTGEIGIGTALPGSALEVVGEITTSDGSTSVAAYGFAGLAGVGMSLTSTNQLTFLTNGLDRWLIANGGQLRGTSSGSVVRANTGSAAGPAYAFDAAADRGMFASGTGLGWSIATVEVMTLAATDLTLGVDFKHTGTKVGLYSATPVAQAAAYTRNATIVEDRTLLASASATTLNNNNVLAALIADLQAIGILG
ncbi:hypothetical protein LCGC14_1712850, partial [marine sediment metagenome]